jgi:protoporphyrinogen oxidase
VRLFPPRNQDNFEGWVAARFGWRLYRIFFKTYTEKVWGVPATQIQSTWAAQRIKDLSLLKAVLNAFGFKNKSQVITTLINSFKYPRKGPGMMWEKCLELCINQGSEILLNHGVSRIQKFDGFYKVFVGNKEFCALNVISTAPISLLPKLLGCEDDEILQAAQNLKHRDFIIVALVMKGQLEFDDNWIYVHSEKVRVGRIQNFGSWSPEMTIPGTSCLGMEYFVNYGEDLWNTPDNQLVAFAVQELRQLNLIPEREIIETGYVVRVPKAYPVYDSDYEENLQKITSYLQNNHPKVLTIGRNGMHRYNNQDHSMLTAVLAVQNIFQKSKHDLWRVNVENEYHEEDTNSASTRGTGRAAPAFTNIER